VAPGKVVGAQTYHDAAFPADALNWLHLTSTLSFLHSTEHIAERQGCNDSPGGHSQLVDEQSVTAIHPDAVACGAVTVELILCLKSSASASSR
jgi:hypothetical protein